MDGIPTLTGQTVISGEALDDAVTDINNRVQSNKAKVDFAVVNEKGQPSVDITDGELTTTAFRVLKFDDGELFLTDQFGRSVEIARKNNGLNIGIFAF